MLNIQEKAAPPAFALFELGFRTFFAAAGVFAVVAIGLWMEPGSAKTSRPCPAARRAVMRVPLRSPASITRTRNR